MKVQIDDLFDLALEQISENSKKSGNRQLAAKSEWTKGPQKTFGYNLTHEWLC